MVLALFDGSLDTGTLVFLVVALGVALAFEFVNGFHDTANAVATVIYTRTLKPQTAVVWSGICNFLGVYLGGIAVAYSIVNLLPVELLVNIGSGAGKAMVLALLLAAITWNLGTWYLGIPASSSHTLIGAILGVGIAHSLLPGHVFGSGVNWEKARGVGLALLLSPVFGFCVAAGLLLLCRWLLPDPKLHTPPATGERPPTWVRGVLVVTCTGVSFFHGSNDGQKGVGLIMLILIGTLSAVFALNLEAKAETVADLVAAAETAERALERHGPPVGKDAAADQAREQLAHLRSHLAGIQSLQDVSPEVRWEVRTHLLELPRTLKSLAADGQLPERDAELGWDARQFGHAVRGITEYAPWWVLLLVALALGSGTMIGWERIVVTVGEKIGKAHLTYAQGGVAEVVAMGTIGLADGIGLPVSTTHVLSSGVAGTMAANRSGLQMKTLRNILTAWVLTLPVSMTLSGTLFLVFLRVLG